MRACEDGRSQCSHELLQKILSLPSRVLVIAGEMEAISLSPFGFNRMVARAGKFLVEEIDEEAAKQVTAFGEMFIFPLRLAGVSGSPCRVIVRAKREK